jgi:hypothetical protein
MTWRKRARTLAGLAAALALVGLITADVLLPDVTFSIQDKAILLTLISGLLGVDLAIQNVELIGGTSGGGTDDE